MRPSNGLPALYDILVGMIYDNQFDWANLEMCVPRHEVVALLVGALNHDTYECAKTGLDLLDLVQKPKAHVRRDLVIARAASVELATKRADDLAQPALVCRMNILVIVFDLELYAG